MCQLVTPSCPGLVPGIHVVLSMPTDVDGRDKPGHDGAEGDERNYDPQIGSPGRVLSVGLVRVAAPHPNPLPVKNGERERSESAAETLAHFHSGGAKRRLEP
ncbi:protein of unknown function [Bradyrhizobium sp. ORS 285]|nr:hypothetical protein BRAO285_2890043 [Bradyrhizobium sp. ORS 285]SMX59705.1 protein of unknown function [Bradyrhizobium sp. ORS 285]